jgi:hypothetical protein
MEQTTASSSRSGSAAIPVANHAPPAESAWRKWAFGGILPFGLYLAIALVQQWIGGAAARGFGGYPDEASHYLSGLMVHDYVTSGFRGSPLAYAANYYLHLPMLGIGHWPPVFYLLQAGWMLIAGTSRSSVLVLIALITAASAFAVFRATSAYLGWVSALIAGALLLEIPVVRWSNNLVMSDTLISLLIFGAALAWGRFLDSGTRGDAVRFAVLASIALLTKPSAGCLAFLPILTILCTGKLRNLRLPAFWLAGLLVVLICAPWYLTAGRLNFYGSSSNTPFLESARRVLALVPRFTAGQLGVILLPCLIGAVLGLRREGRGSGKLAVLIMAPVSVLLLSMISHVELEPRYLMPAFLPMLVLAGYGVACITAALPFRGRGLPALLTALLAAVFAFGHGTPQKPPTADGLEEFVARMHHSGVPPDALMLISGNGASSDGRIIAGFAESSPDRPRETLVRAVKIFASSDWNGDDYALRVSRPEEIVDELDRDGISLIAIDLSTGWGIPRPHQSLLLAALQKDPGRAQLIYSTPAGYRLYRYRATHSPRMPDAVLRNLKEKLADTSLRGVSAGSPAQPRR